MKELNEHLGVVSNYQNSKENENYNRELQELREILVNVHDVTYLMVEIKPVWEQLLRLYNTYAVMSTLKTQTDEFRDVNKELKDLFRKG